MGHTLALILLLRAVDLAPAQQPPAPVPAVVEARLVTRMGQDCGVGEAPDALRRLLAQVGPGAEDVVIEILKDGIPVEIREDTRRSAAEVWRSRSAWLKANRGTELGRRLAPAQDRFTGESFVAHELAGRALVYRENALQALELIGTGKAVPAIERAVAADPRLATRGESALRSIRAR